MYLNCFTNYECTGGSSNYCTIRCTRAKKCLSLKTATPKLVDCNINDKFQLALIKQNIANL